MATTYATRRDAEADGWVTLRAAKAAALAQGVTLTDEEPQGRETAFGYGLWLVRGGQRTEVPTNTVALTEEANMLGKPGAYLTMVRADDLSALLNMNA